MTTQPPPTPSKKVRLRWTGEGMEYAGGTEGGPPVVIDGKSLKGPGPMDALLLALAGCMAVDVQVILERSRVPLAALAVEVEGTRANSHPKRYTRLSMVFDLEGPEDGHRGKVERAVELSKEKFCSVLHSLRPEIELEIDIRY